MTALGRDLGSTSYESERHCQHRSPNKRWMRGEELPAQEGGAKWTHKRRVIHLAASIVTVAAIGLLAGQASAAPCGSKCYGSADWNNAAYNGAIAFVRVGPFYVQQSCQEFAVETLWVHTPVGFIEQGLHVGTHYLGGCHGLEWYWAEQRGGGCCPIGYTDHYPSAPVDYFMDFASKITYVGGPDIKWGLYQDGVARGFAPYHGAPSVALETGLEAHGTSYFDVHGWTQNLQKKNPSTGGWSYYWPGAVLIETPGAPYPWTRWCDYERCVEQEMAG